MNRQPYLLLFSCLLASSTIKAQDSQPATAVAYHLTAETAVGSGDFTAYQLATNRHHTLATRPNTAYLRGAVSVAHQWAHDWKLTGAVDVITSVHADHKAYLQQCYLTLSWRDLFVEAGAREQEPVLRDPILSSGAFIKGNNAKPVPQIHVGTNGFLTVPYTKEWLQVSADFGYGKLMDSDYRKKQFQHEGSGNWHYTTGTLYHQKHLYLRTNPQKPVFVTAGIEHVALFGGTEYSTETGALVAKKKPTSLQAFWKMILPVGDKNYFENDAMEDWIFGNHVGSITLQLAWNINSRHQVQVYMDNPFEDGSGMRKGNGWDGLWGLQYQNTAAGPQPIRSAVVEYLQTTNQSGPLHWDSGDYPEPIRSQITDLVTGNDNYYNHSFYGAYAHYGMTHGNALLTSPIYNTDGYADYRDNRVKAWHAAVNGELTPHLSYLIKGSYREGWGTYHAPLTTKHHSFDAMLQGTYTQGPWQLSGAYALDKGNIYGDNHTINIKISYHGKLL